MSDVCRKSFRHVNTLKVHKSSDTREHPHSCDLCKSSFSRKSTLIQHERTHAGENPYSCGVCNKIFYYLNALKMCESVYTMESVHILVVYVVNLCVC